MRENDQRRRVAGCRPGLALSLGRVHAFAVEGCGSYGIGLARFLRRHGHLPVEVSRPPRAGLDECRERVMPSMPSTPQGRPSLAPGRSSPKLTDGQVEAIRLVKIARDTAVTSRATATVPLKAVLVTAPQELRDQLEPLSDFKLLTACADLDSTGDLSDSADAIHHTLASLARRWFALHDEIKINARHLEALTRTAAPQLVDAYGVGNRKANAALYRAVIVRMRWHQPTIAYVTRRTTDGLSKKDIIRSLERYIARELYRPSSLTSRNNPLTPCRNVTPGRFKVSVQVWTIEGLQGVRVSLGDAPRPRPTGWPLAGGPATR
jgi:transposase